MADWPVQVQTNELVTISTSTIFASSYMAMRPGNLEGSGAWPAANRAIFMPFTVPRPMTFFQLASYNGGTATGNVDMGIYDYLGTRLVSIGSTAQSGTDTLQAFNITDTTLGIGLYYLALAESSATSTFHRCDFGSAGNFCMTRSMGLMQMASALPLPTTATFAAITSAYLPICMASGKATF